MISVAMTTYNGQQYIEQQLQSIINQTTPVDEIIICDDGSTDETCNIIKRFDDKRIILVCNPQNLGYIENFYQAIARTSGDYIFLADQDDIWRPDKVEKMVAFMERQSCVAACSNFELMDQDGKVIAERENYQIHPKVLSCKKPYLMLTTLQLVFRNVAQGCTYCFDKTVKKIYVDLHNTEVIHDHQIMLIASCAGKVGFLNEKLISYRIHEKNSIGFSKKNKEYKLKKALSREPFMYRFFRQLNAHITVKGLYFYKLLYYLRIPAIREMIFRKLFGI